jgi:hypothetical protein
MKKLIFFMTFLIFTRIGMGMGISATPIGIGNFFLGAPSITETNLNQVLGLLVGADGQPGSAGVSGANGVNGINGLPGVAGTQGLPGTQGVKGDPGAPGAPGAPGVAGAPGKDGGVGSVGLGGGAVAIDSCDNQVNIAVGQKFMGTYFGIETVTISEIASSKCEGYKVSIFLEIMSKDKAITTPIRTLQCTEDINIKSTELIFDVTACNSKVALTMAEIGNNIGLEFIKPPKTI